MTKRKKLHITELENYFKKRRFSTHELYDFYNSFEPGIPEKTVSWRLYELTKLGILARVKQGTYQFSNKSIYHPDIDNDLEQIHKKIKNHFPFIDVCVWNTKILNEFMIHQPGKFMSLIETESEVTESLFAFMKENYKNVFLNPDTKTIENYIQGENKTIIIKSLISEAPTIKYNDIETITLEKMLVDIYCDDKLYNTFQGAEMKNIYENAFAKYHINYSTLLRYAARRGRKKDIETQLP